MYKHGIDKKNLCPSDYKVRNNFEFQVVVLGLIFLSLFGYNYDKLFILEINLMYWKIFEVYSIFSRD